MKKIIILLFLGITGCTTPKTQTAGAIYDFGARRLGPPAEAQKKEATTGQPRLNASLLVPDIVAPVWLDSTAIQYRLAYQDLARVYVYGANRWAATPASLLAQRVRSRIGMTNESGVVNVAEGTRTDYALRMELEEFTQVFDTADRSRAIVKFRASLIDRRTRSLMSQRNFITEQPAATADAPGAVHALTDASDDAVDTLIDWLAEELSDGKKHAAPAHDVGGSNQGVALPDS